jgi:hypothetical protein
MASTGAAGPLDVDRLIAYAIPEVGQRIEARDVAF